MRLELAHALAQPLEVLHEMPNLGVDLIGGLAHAREVGFELLVEVLEAALVVAHLSAEQDVADLVDVAVRAAIGAGLLRICHGHFPPGRGGGAHAARRRLAWGWGRLAAGPGLACAGHRSSSPDLNRRRAGHACGRRLRTCGHSGSLRRGRLGAPRGPCRRLARRRQCTTRRRPIAVRLRPVRAGNRAGRPPSAASHARHPARASCAAG